jgi:hypothetical protein
MRFEPGYTRIHNGQLVDGTGTVPVRDAVVVIDNGRISFQNGIVEAGTLAAFQPTRQPASR